jgi:adenosine deaminase
MTEDLSDERFVAGLPKAELHLHLEATLEPAMMFQLAARNRIQLAYPSVEALAAAYRFQDLQSFLDMYYAGMSVLVTKQDFHDLTWAYLQRARADHVLHAEVFFDPQAHTERGVPIGVAIEGIAETMAEGQSRIGISSYLFLSFLRDLSEEQAFATLEQALPFRDMFIGIGLDSAELGNPPSKFERVFARCRSLGFRVVAHAGEEGPADYVRESLDLLKAERIDHGVHCLDDPEVVARLLAEQIPLTVCPLSNVALGVFPSLAEHNLKRLIESGLRVTVNSDGPAYFGGYINRNYIAAQQALGLSRSTMIELARNSFLSSYLPEKEKRHCCALVDAYAAASASSLQEGMSGSIGPARAC